VIDPLRAMGCHLQAREDRLPPLTVAGRELHGVEHRLPVASAQVKSALIFAGLQATGETAIVEPSPSRDHTERLLARSRAPVERDGLTVRVTATDELEVDEIVVPGDPSSAAFFIAAAAAVPGSRITVCEVGLNWTRSGFLRIAERMGAVVVGEAEGPPPEWGGGAHAGQGGLQELPQSADSEPVGDLDVRAAPLEATTVGGAEVPLAIDELPLVALLGCFAEGDTTVADSAELRVKESDRIAGVVEGLRGVGADIEETEDGFVVHGPCELRGGAFDARGDHRLAMLGALAGLASRDGVEVEGMESVAVSYPTFEADLRALARS
jgi:3-phosphoshikimate 1-carboxyvinyltransferase